MSYTKIAGTVPGLQVALAAVLGQFGVEAPVAGELIAAGSRVRLETADDVWVSSIVHDKPDTLQVDLVTVAIALRDGAPWQKANGQYVAVVFWHGLFPDVLASLGVSTARKALMMVALGEPQPQVPIVPPAVDGPTQRDAIELGDTSDRSIRFVITAARELEAGLEDVLGNGETAELL